MTNDRILFTNAYFYQDALSSSAPSHAVQRLKHFAVEGGRFAAFADDSREFGAARFDRTVDLGGRAVLPALTDSHIHLLDLSLSLREIDLEAARDEQDAAAIVARARPAPRPGEWITGGRWAHNFWPGQHLPSAASLDKYFPNNPVVLSSKCGHVVWTNTAALRAAGIYDAPPTVEGGAVDADPATGRAIGTLKENAIALVSKHIPVATAAEQRECLIAGIRHLHAFGILNVHNVEPRHYFEHMLAVEDAGGPPLRIYDYFPDMRPNAVAAYMAELGPRNATRRTRAVGKKIFTDGSLGGRTAFMIAPYEGEPDNRGIACMTPAELGELIAEAETLAMPCAIHAIGDAAVRFTLEEIRRNAGPQTGPARGGRLPHRIEHLQLLAAEDIALLREVRAVSSSQPIHLSADLLPLRQFWGARSRHAYAFRTALECGALLIFGSDAPVESANPFIGIYAALTRQGLDGEPRGGYYTEEKLTLAEAIHAYAAAPPAIVGDGGLYGEIAAGQCADFVVLDETRPAEALAPEEWKDVRAAALYHEGALVFAREA